MISCSAYKIMELWEEACKNNSGESDKWYGKGSKYFEWKLSAKDFKDGSVVGTVYSILPTGHKPSSSFRIDANGSVVRAPTFLRKSSEMLEKALVAEYNQLRIH